MADHHDGPRAHTLRRTPSHHSSPPILPSSIPTPPLPHPAHTSFARQGGTFHLELLLPTTYPFKPPTLAFRTKVYHPNVANDERGGVCLPLLRPDGWKPATRAADVLRAARERLAQPDPDDALEQAIASEFREKRAQWEKTAREWTARYAKG